MRVRDFAWRCALSLFLATAGTSPVLAKYAAAQLANVPIQRVLTSLADKAAAKPKDAALQFNLARAYAMAYASKADQVEVQAADKDELWLGYTPDNVPFAAQPTDDKAKQALAEKHLAQALETYEAGLKLAPTDAVGRLGYAWCLEQAGQKEAAIAEYRKVIDHAWKNEGELTQAGLRFRSLVTEAAGYLKPLLNASKDAAEIKDLDEKVAKINAIPRPVTPIAIPLVNGLTANDFADHKHTVKFDADGSGLQRSWTWIKPGSGWLVYDKQNTGRVDSALQLFGNVTFWMFWQHGYEPLAALDDNHDGVLRGSELDDLAIWCDANSNGRSETGEVKSLAAHGIVALSCAYEIDMQHPDRIEFSRAGVTFEDGTTRPTFDVRLHRR